MINIDNQLLEKFSLVKAICFDFDGVFTDNLVYTNELGHEMVCCNRSDGIGVSTIKKLGIKVFIVSSEKNKVVEMRSRKLNIDCYQGVNDKAKLIETISKEINIPLYKFAFVGNDINDLSALETVGLPIAVEDSYCEIFKFCKYKTKSRGGKGAVREICDILSYAIKTYTKTKNIG